MGFHFRAQLIHLRLLSVMLSYRAEDFTSGCSTFVLSVIRWRIPLNSSMIITLIYLLSLRLGKKTLTVLR